MWNFQPIVFIWKQTYWQIFKSALVYLIFRYQGIFQNDSEWLLMYLYFNIKTLNLLLLVTSFRPCCIRFDLLNVQSYITGPFCFISDFLFLFKAPKYFTIYSLQEWHFFSQEVSLQIPTLPSSNKPLTEVIIFVTKPQRPTTSWLMYFDWPWLLYSQIRMEQNENEIPVTNVVRMAWFGVKCLL